MNRPRTAAKPRKASTRSHRYPGASTNPLTAKQKGIVVMLARRAFAHQRAGGDFAAWRRDEQEKAVGQTSLTVCCQADYNMLVSHFEGLAGNAVKEFKAALRPSRPPYACAVRAAAATGETLRRRTSAPSATRRSTWERLPSRR